MVRAVDNKTAPRVDLKGFEPVKPREHGRPEVAFKPEGEVQAPKAGLAGHSLFAARGSKYRDLSPAQRASVLSAIERCRPSIEQTYGTEAFEAAMNVLREAMEFTKKVPA